MKKFLPIILVAAFALTACGSTTTGDLSAQTEEVVDQKSAYEVVYEGDGYILNAEGILIETKKGSHNETTASVDPFDADYIDAQEAARESSIEDQEEVEETDPVEDEEEYTTIATFSDKMIINYEDGIYVADMDGSPLTEEYMTIVSNYSGIDNTKEPEKYLCVREDAIDVLNTDLEVEKTIEVSNINTVEGYGDYMVYNVTDISVDTLSGIMNLEGEIIMNPSRYYSIEPLSAYSKGISCADDVFICKYKDQHDIETIDIVSKDANILVDSLLAFTFVDNDKIAALRSGIVGFMDYSGEWITKNAI